MAIPLSRRGVEDKMLCSHTRCGNYLTCSGYKCARQMKRNGELRGKALGESSTSENGGRGWREVMVLFAVDVSNIEWAVEIFSRMVAFLSGKLKDHKDGELLTYIGCTLWSLWKGRNGVLFDQQSVTMDGIITQRIKLARDFLVATGLEMEQATVPDQPHSLHDIEHRWRPPATNMIKVNCDAGWSKESRTGSLGVVIRDDRGLFNGAFFKQIPRVDSPLVVEALAIREGLHFAWGQQYRKLEVESDSRQLINAIRGEWSFPAEIEVLVVDIHHLMRYMKVKF
ncbi:hypothetical protein LIER_27311 [Lithospermum erythrorhizon]|uniref:RNase H type-1 domain-containing protein n=1 Tax=Lithospermum erythrorhizon TaxID=34254 RepID=A0AAV3RFM7_LITER